MAESKPLWKKLKNYRGYADVLLDKTNKTVKSDDLIKHMRKKYNLDVGVIKYDAEPSTSIDSFFVNSKNLKKNLDHLKDLQKNEHKITNPQEYEHYQTDLKTLPSVNKNLNKKDGVVFIQNPLYKHVPEIVGHEVGHAANEKTKLGFLYKTLGSDTGRQIGRYIDNGLTGAMLFVPPKPKTLALMGALGMTARYLPQSVRVLDEYLATRKAHKDIEEIGGIPQKQKLNTLLKTYYKPLLASLAVKSILITPNPISRKFQNTIQGGIKGFKNKA